MTEPRSCEFTVQAFPEDEPRKCGKTGVKRATRKNGFDMVYCTIHWKSAEDYLKALGADMEDYSG